MTAGATNTFLRSARTNHAAVFMDICGDSRTRRVGHGTCWGMIQALTRAAGGMLGLMAAFNVISSAIDNDGLVRAGRRTVTSSNALGSGIEAFPGCTGITNPFSWDLASGNTISTSPTEASTTAITVVGDVSTWPAASLYVRIEDEIIFVPTRTGQSLGGTLVRGQLGSSAKAHTSGVAIDLLGAGLDQAVWLPWQHAMLRNTTLVADINDSVTSLQLTSAAGWPLSGDIRVDTEYMNFTRSAGSTTLTVVRARYTTVGGAAAGAHTAGAPIALADWTTFSALQASFRSELGPAAGIRYAVTFENPTGAVVGTGAMRLSINPVQGGGESPVGAIQTSVASSARVNPTTADAAGTLQGLGVTAPPTIASGITVNRKADGICAGINVDEPVAGPLLADWQYLGSDGRRGGLVQTFTTSGGGRRMLDYVMGLMRSAPSRNSLVRKFQSMRWFSSSANHNANAPRLVHVWDFASNDVADTRLSFATAGQAWTRQYEKLGTVVSSGATTIPLNNVTGLATSGHLLNTRTGERVSYTNISGTSLTGCTRGDFGTTAAAFEASDPCWFAFPVRDPDGLPALILYASQEYATLWNLATIVTSPASYPIAVSGTFDMHVAGTGTPSATTELAVAWARPICTSDTTTAVAIGGTVTTLAEREYRYRQWVTSCNTHLTAAVLSTVAAFEVVDLGPGIMSAAEAAAGGYSDVNTVTTLNGAINSAVTSLVVASATGMGTDGHVWIEGECIYFGARSSTTLSSCVRGVNGTTAASHGNGVAVAEMDHIHQLASGFKEALERWSERNLTGAGGAGAASTALSSIKAGATFS